VQQQQVFSGRFEQEMTAEEKRVVFVGNWLISWDKSSEFVGRPNPMNDGWH